MFKILFSVILIILINTFYPDTLGEPNPMSPYKFTLNTRSEEIERNLSTKAIFYKGIEWSNVELSVNENNIEINKNIAKIDADMQTLYAQLQKLHLAKNIKQIEQNIETLQNARKNIIQTAERQLKTINYQGLYLVIHNNVSPLEKEDVLVNNMRNVIAPTAISTANAVFIQNITVLQNNRLEYDYIRQNVSGTIEPVNSLYTDANKSEGYFIQIRQEKIFPLQKAPKSVSNNPINTTNIKVIDLYNNDNYNQDLNLMLPDADLRNRISNNWLIPNLEVFKKNIAKYNATSQNAEANIAIETQKQLHNIDIEIASAQQELVSKRAEVQKILQVLNLSNCSINQLYTCVTNAEYEISQKMKKLETEKLLQKEKELLTQIFDISGQGGDPAKALATETCQKIQTLNNINSTVKNFLQELTITNGIVSSYGSASSTDLFRNIEYFWMYPIATNQNGYKVGVVLRFKMRNAKADLVGKYRMEMVLSERELAENPQAQTMMDMMKLECDMTYNGNSYVTAEMMGQVKKDTAQWDINADSLILMSRGKREAAKMVKIDGGFILTQETKEGTLTLKYIKQK